MGLNKSAVLSILFNPIISFVIPYTVPVNIGLFIEANDVFNPIICD